MTTIAPRPACVTVPPAPPACGPTGPVTKAGGFLKDVVEGGKTQLGDDAQGLLHPIQTLKRSLELLEKGEFLRSLTEPYTSAIKAGRPGLAVGRALTNAVLLAGAVLGGRALVKGATQGGASVGFEQGGIFGALGKAVKGATQFVGTLISDIGFLIRRLLPGGAGVGLG